MLFSVKMSGGENNRSKSAGNKIRNIEKIQFSVKNVRNDAGIALINTIAYKLINN